MWRNMGVQRNGEGLAEAMESIDYGAATCCRGNWPIRRAGSCKTCSSRGG